ncbi:MAG: hypothetical protein JEY99_01575 [Spirochaetales bacterium]|nr:hypothetical protein [Spirochaetales bacterium]
MNDRKFINLLRNHSETLLIITDENDRIIDANAESIDKLGIVLEEQRCIQDIYCDPGLRKMVKNNVLSEGKPVRQETLLKCKFGIILTCLEYSFGENDKGEFKLYSIFIDVSDYIDFSINTNKLNLEIMEAHKRLNELYSTMAQQEKLASIGTLAAGIAHEINNPIGYIKSNNISMGKYNNLIVDQCKRFRAGGSMSEEDLGRLSFALEDMKSIIVENEQGISQIASITSELKQFARQSDIQEIEEYDLNEAINHTLTISRNKYKHIAEIELSFGDLPLIQCFGSSVNQVILNLIINASQAIEGQAQHSMGTIRITTSFNTDTDNIAFILEDSGPGVPENIISKIFNPFFTTKDIGSGTGLGLSICSDIITQKHQGKIWYEQSPLGGAQFTFTLPKRFRNA